MLYICILDDEDFDPNAADSDDDGGDDDNSSDSSDDEDEDGEEADDHHDSNIKRSSTQSKPRNVSTKQSARKAIPVKGKVATKTPASSTTTTSTGGTAIKTIKTEKPKATTFSTPNHIIDFTSPTFPSTTTSSSPGTDSSDNTGKISHHTDMVIDVSECEEKEEKAGQGDRRADDVCVLDGEEVPDYPSSKRVKVEQDASDVVITIA